VSVHRQHEARSTRGIVGAPRGADLVVGPAAVAIFAITVTMHAVAAVRAMRRHRRQT
jgi:hypothetical protein